MSIWSNVVTGFDSNDETLNFGTRAVALGDGNVYETNTLTIIESTSEETLKPIPSCNAFCFPQGNGIAIDKTFILLDASCHNLLINTSFESTINTFAISKDGAFAFFGLSSFELVCIHLSSPENHLFLKTIGDSKDNKDQIHKIIINETATLFKVYLILNSGKILLSCLDVSHLLELNANNKVLAEDVNLNFTEINNGFSMETIANQSYLHPDSYIDVFLSSGNMLYLWSEKESCFLNKIQFGENLKLKKINSNEQVIVALTNHGDLIQVCPYSFGELARWKESKVTDFTFVENLNGDMGIDILLVTEKKELCLIKPLNFTTKFKFQIGSPVFLIQQLNDCESTLYIEGIGTDKVDTVRVKNIIDSNPELRLERLIAKGKFVEAEEFAKLFDLSLEHVHKSKVKWLMGELQLTGKAKEDQMSNFRELFSLLELIKDNEFVGECCIKTIPPDIKKTRELVEYARARLQKGPQTKTIKELLKSLKCVVNTIGTFELINGDSASSEQWLNFSSANPIILCQQFLAEEQVKEAEIVCSRNKLRMKSELSPEMANSLFEIIPQSVPVEEVLEWLLCYTPVLLQSQSQSLPRLISWVVKRAKNVEHQKPDSWPQKALNFTKKVHSFIKDLIGSEMMDKRVDLYQSISLPASSLNQLRMFYKNLYYLLILKEKYFVSIDYHSFTQGNDFEQDLRPILPLLFNSVPIHEIPNFIKNFVNLVCADYSKEVDSIISAYVNTFISRFYSEWHTRKNRWEGRCVAFTNCIHDINEKLKAVNFILNKSAVPWSRDVQHLVDSIKNVKHPLMANIKIHLNNIQKKIILRNYGFQLDKINMEKFEVETFMVKMFEANNEEALEDVKNLVKSDSGNQSLLPYETMWFIAITKGNFEKPYYIIKKELSQDEILSVCENVAHMIRLRLSFRKYENKDNLVRGLEYIISSTEKYENSKAQHVREIAMNIKTNYEINVSYKKNDSWENVYSRKKKEALLKYCVSHIEKDTSEDDEKSLNCNNELTILSIQLNITFHKCVFELASQCCSNKKLLAATHFLKLLNESHEMKMDSGSFADFMTDMISLYHSHAQSSQENQDVINTLGYAACTLFNLCETRNIMRSADIVKIYNLFMPPTPKPEWMSMYEDPQEPRSLMLSNSVLIQLINCVRREKEPIAIDLLNRDAEFIINSLSNDLTSFNQLCNLFGLLLKDKTLDVKVTKKAAHFTTQTVSTLIYNMLGSRNFDLKLALVLIHHFHFEQAFQWLSNVASKLSAEDLKWDHSLGLLGKFYTELHTPKDPDVRKFFHDIYTMTTWGIKIMQYGMPAKEAFNDSVEDQKKLLKKLITVPDIELEVLQQYCMDMHLDEQKCFLFYLEHLLLSWKPIFTVKENKLGMSQIIVENKIDELLMKCKEVVRKIKNEENLSKILFTCIWDQVNVYNYEIFMVILDIIPQSNPQKCQPYHCILNFLKTYTRIGEITESESMNWFNINPSSQALPAIAQYRLPLNKFPCDSVKSLKPELSLDTYKVWLQAPVWSNGSVDKDLICSFTITNLKHEEPEGESSWNLQGTKTELLEKVMECVKLISSFEIAVAALYFVVNHVIPPGFDQVEAAQKCFIKAKDWVNAEATDTALKGKARAEKKYLIVATVHILHKFGLGHERYTKLALQPAELIAALYQDPSLLEEDSYDIRKPNVNKAVECIASLHSVNIAKITLELLSNWLDSETCTFNGYQFNEDSQGSQFSDNVKRACYLLLGCKELGKLESYLVGIAFSRNEEANRRSVGVRLRALQCLTAITTVDQIQEITARDIDTIRTFIKVLEMIFDLENFGFPYTVKGFEQASKENIISILMKNVTRGRIKLAVRIARYHDIQTSELWNEIIKNMINCLMAEDLESLLPELENIMIDHDLIKKAWNCIIDRALISDDCDQVIKLLKACPDTSYLDLPTIHQYLQNANKLDAVKSLRVLFDTQF